MSKSMQWQFLMGLGGGLVVAGLVGCAGEISRPPASQLAEGLNLLDARDPGYGLNAAYLKAGRVIYMETRVGPPIPEVYKQDAPDGPQNEMDIRFVDANNHTFYVMRGGDGYVDGSWDAEIKASRHLKPELYANRESDFKLAKEAANALQVKLPATFADHVFHMRRFANEATAYEQPEMIARAAVYAQKAPTVNDAINNHMLNVDPANPAASAGAARNGDSAYAYNGYGNWSVLETDKYSGSTGCFAWICAASHSATRMWDYEGYYDGNGGWHAIGWTFQVDANNHGRHATDSGMGYDCYSQGGWFYNAWVTGATAGGADGNYDNQGGCQTSYSWNSGGFDHLCNDDAAYELWQAKTGSQATGHGYNGNGQGNGDSIGFQYYGSGWCRGSACGQNPAYFACNCGSFGGCGGDWNTPNCP